jgi:hypothetical protein
MEGGGLPHDFKIAESAITAKNIFNFIRAVSVGKLRT